jgi:hypothetical protein
MSDLKLVIDGNTKTATLEKGEGFGDAGPPRGPISCIAIQPTANDAFFVTTDFEDFSAPERLAYRSLEEVLDVIRKRLQQRASRQP